MELFVAWMGEGGCGVYVVKVVCLSRRWVNFRGEVRGEIRNSRSRGWSGHCRVIGNRLLVVERESKHFANG